MKLALLADAHANLIALDTVFKDITTHDIDHIIFAGDAIGYYPYVNEVCNVLREKVAWCVMGNHDAFVTGRLPVSKDKRIVYALDYTLDEISAENMNWLKSLPEFLELDLSGKILKIFHGSPWDYLEEYIYPDYSFFNRFNNIEGNFIILAHTHYPMVKHIGEKIIINPGSCGQPRDYNPKASYAILDIDKGEVDIKRVSYNINTVIKKAIELGFDKSVCKILARRSKMKEAL